MKQIKVYIVVDENNKIREGIFGMWVTRNIYKAEYWRTHSWVGKDNIGKEPKNKFRKEAIITYQ